MTEATSASPAVARSASVFRFDRRILAIFLAIDAVLIALYVALAIPRVEAALMPIRPWLILRDDWSAGEIANYAKWTLGALLLALAARRRPGAGLAALSLAMAILLADDAGQLHERGGALLARLLSLPSVLGLRAVDLGELLVWAALGVPVLAGFALAWRRGGPRGRRGVAGLAALLALLVGFAVVADMIHSIILEIGLGGARGDQVAALIEEGGEMIVASFMLAQIAAAIVRPALSEGRRAT